MSIEPPTPEIIRSIEAAVAWFESAKITGIKVVDAKDASGAKDKVVEKDPAAPPLWARFYEIETGRPFFCGRDGVKKYSLAEIERERRTGYSWLNSWPQSLLAKDYPEWQRRSSKLQTPKSP